MTRGETMLLTLAAAALLAGGCAHGGTGAVGTEEFPEQPTVVKVTNNNWSDMNVYFVHGSWRERLGTVSSFTTRSFEVPEHMLASADRTFLLADPIGSSRTYTSPPLLLTPGQTVTWRLENNLQLSSAFIR